MQQQGRKVFTLQTLPDCGSKNLSSISLGKTAGFSLHAGVAGELGVGPIEGGEVMDLLNSLKADIVTA